MVINSKEIKHDPSHAFFVDDLKLYATCIEELIKLLEIVAEYSRDMGMSFGESKCTYQCIKRGKRSGIGTSLKVMHLTVLEIKEGDHYKYLGIDKSIGYDGPLNKEGVTKIRVQWNKQICRTQHLCGYINNTNNWNFELVKGRNLKSRCYDKKATDHEWFIPPSQQYKQTLCQRKQGGRGLKSIEDLYETRTISLAEHISEAAGSHELLNLVGYHEENGIVRLGKEFRQRITDITQSSNVVKGTKQIHKKVWKQKDTHGYHQKQIEERENIDTSKTNNWMNNRFTSHIEGYIRAMQEQEINTRSLRKRREKTRTRKEL